MIDLLRLRIQHLIQIFAVLLVASCGQSFVKAETAKPILVSAPTSTRAVVFDAVAFTPEPFSATPTSLLYGLDKPTSIMLFAMNLSLKDGEDASVLTADAEDAAHRHYNLKVDYVGKVPGQEWLSQVNLQLDKSMGDVGDVLIMITYQGVNSNRVRVGIGHVGGGLEDDPGAAPTPAPPYTISGRITSDSTGFGGVSVALSGSQTGTTTTDVNGNYSFTITSVGNYTITPSKNFYAFTPSSTTFDNLSGNQTSNFSGALLKYSISGFILEGNGSPLAGATVALSGSVSRETTTGSDGKYVFTELPAGADYTLTPSAGPFFNVNPQKLTFNSLSGNQTAASFTAARKTYTISGQVRDDQGTGLDDLPVTLKSSADDSASKAVMTTGGGLFSFKDVPAGYNYTITPSNTSLFAFTSQNINALNGDATVPFNGTLRKYSIGGVVKDRAQNGVSGVTVTLSGQLNTSTLTDAGGNYLFSNLPAGKNYIVAAAKTDYIVSEEPRTYNLLKDEKADFTAIRFYKLSGRVTNNGGKGIFGILMSLNGPETGTMITDSDGSYSFTVTTAGNYTLNLSKEQNFYQFSPAGRSFNNLSDHQITNFIRTLSITSPTYVLEFDGTPMSVDYGIFWPQDSTLGHFFWEFWAMPGDDTYGRYLVSDGYGGAHSLLFGFNPGPRGYSLFGNIWDGTKPVYFNSDDGPSPGEWGHFAVGWDGKNIITYYDGVPIGKQLFDTPRVSLGTGWGATLLLIGGSTHQNLIGRIAQVRGYEDNNPRESSPESSFAPETVFSVEGQLLSYYFKPAATVADLSNGYNGVPHRGWPRGMQQFYFDYSCPGCPEPKFVIDPTAPDFSNPSNPGQVSTLVFSPPPTPSGARVFDSFARNNSTYILGGKGGLGATEAGTAGTKTWQTGLDAAQPQPFGILGGHAVLLANETSITWVSTGASNGNLDVRVERTLGSFGSGLNTGLCFRVIDKNNYFFAYTTDDQADPSRPRKLSLGYYLSGIRTTLASGIAMPNDSWKTLRVVTTQAGNISVYANDALVYSTTSTINASATGAGLYNNGAGMGLTNRWDNFTVLDAP